MLKWALLFFVVALIVQVFGFTTLWILIAGLIIAHSILVT